jgi:hypothetical protein
MKHVYTIGKAVNVLLPARKADWGNLEATEWRRAKVVGHLMRYHNNGQPYPVYIVEGLLSDPLFSHVREQSIRPVSK